MLQKICQTFQFSHTCMTNMDYLLLSTCSCTHTQHGHRWVLILYGFLLSTKIFLSHTQASKRGKRSGYTVCIEHIKKKVPTTYQWNQIKGEIYPFSIDKQKKEKRSKQIGPIDSYQWNSFVTKLIMKSEFKYWISSRMPFQINSHQKPMETSQFDWKCHLKLNPKTNRFNIIHSNENVEFSRIIYFIPLKVITTNSRGFSNPECTDGNIFQAMPIDGSRTDMYHCFEFNLAGSCIGLW